MLVHNPPAELYVLGRRSAYFDFEAVFVDFLGYR